MMTLPDLTPDCQSCDALCCVLLAYDASAAFARSKPACTPCQNLTDANQCRIHAGLQDRGFSGCVAFDCYGAGQIITGQVFKGRSWRDDASLLPAIDAAFRIQRRLHETLALVAQSASLPLTEVQRAARQSVMTALSAPRSAADLQGPEPVATLSQAAGYFATLRAVTPPRQ